MPPVDAEEEEQRDGYDDEDDYDDDEGDEDEDDEGELKDRCESWPGTNAWQAVQPLPLSCPIARNTGGKVEPTRTELSQKSDQIQPNKKQFEPTYWNVSHIACAVIFVDNIAI